MPPIATVGVVGAGIMGAGIAQAAACAGCTTILRDVDDGILRRARATIERSTAKLVEKGQLSTATRDAALDHIMTTTGLAAMSAADLVIEAITENAEAKAAVYRDLDAACPARTILATNTSSLSVTSLAASSGRSDRFVGLHFFNPVPLMPLVEVVRGLSTSDETHATALAFVRQLGKEAVQARDVPGFVVNLLLVPYLLDAVRAVERGVASTVDIDRGMMLGCGHPMGPLTLLDFVGLDTVVRIGEIMFDEYREQRYAPPALLRRMVAAGWLGRKNGRGFYDYGGDTPVPMEIR